MWGGSVSRQQLQNSIGGLHKLTNVPERPKENAHGSESPSNRRLAWRRETEITNNLAFLSATTDNARKVMAVCIEEDSSGEACTIRISSNTGGLDEIVRGLRVCTRILEQAARRGNPKSREEEALHKQVVILDFNRILSRLRSRHAKKTIKTNGKPALITQLNTEIFAESVKPSSVFTETVRDKARTLKVLYTKLEQLSDLKASVNEAREILGQIVKQAHELTLAVDLDVALQSSVPNSEFRKHLSKAIGKLGRYYSATLELVCAARDKECRIFQHITVEPFEILVPASVVDKAWKVHAEIQLLFFYELHPDKPRPRTICSSKCACYLCNLFFDVHGGFHISQTHGRLYDKWILPYWLEIPSSRLKGLRRTVLQFKERLDCEINKGHKLKSLHLSHPNESVLPLPAYYPPSTAVSEAQPSQVSTSTIHPQLPSARATPSHTNSQSRPLSMCAELPLTPPITPTKAPPSTAVPDPQHSSPPITTNHPHKSTDTVQAFDNASQITLKHHELPFRQALALSTPSLHILLDEVSLTLEFDQVRKGQLSITQEGDADVRAEECRVVTLGDILTTEEMRLDCLEDARELRVQLRDETRGIVCFTFGWG